ncbi:MAG: hypothetical protein A2091_09930 [Desulfuromonadales bacterium GWD2_61_12]|nr:MAG: hypothetical protein A2091_09930 [Desulfuromonadales bacterium GWD2_61_12]OGR34076.1 MAG: hypothetical protein A2005_02400 [Desulfuromonadales bacterium GWC2_61_20]
MTMQRVFTPLMILVLSGCMAAEMPQVSNTLALPTPPSAATDASLAGVVPAETETSRAPSKIDQGKFSLVLKNVELKQALAILSKDSPVPIVAEPGVTGRVTVNILDKPLGDLLYTLLRPLGYTATIEDGMIVVGPSRPITRTFVLNYLKDKRVSSSITKASISTGSGSGSDAGSSSSSSSGSSQGNVSVTTSGSNDCWSETLKGLDSIVYGQGKKDGGTTGNIIVTNQLSGVIQVTAPPETLERVSVFLANVEREVKRQVLIQAHIVEIELKDEFSLGIDWKAFLDSAHKSSIAQHLGLSSAPFSNVFVIDINSSGPDFNVLLDTFKEQGDVNMLSSPKISTLNNQKAVFKRTTNEVSWVQSVLRGSTGGPADLVINTAQIDEVGLFLDVTPNVAASGSITMQVHPSITEVKPQPSFSPDGNSSKPVITVREIDTIVDVQSGQTMVIGGLISDTSSSVKRGIPFLGDIPVVGWLFSNYNQKKGKTELVIFLTPYILNTSAIDDIRKEHESRLWGPEGINRFVKSALK